MINEEEGGRMKLWIQQRVFAWTDSYDVYDEAGEPRYEVKSDFLSQGDAYELCYEDPADEIPGLLLVLAIDAANCNHKK